MCSIGSLLNSECNKTFITKKVGEKKVLSEFSFDDIEVLLLRTGISLQHLTKRSTICFHHEKYYISSDSYFDDGFCCNPLILHEGRSQGLFKQSSTS